MLTDRNDFDWALKKIGELGLDEINNLLMVPAYGKLEPKILADWILKSGAPVRFQIQIQKYIWEPDTRSI